MQWQKPQIGKEKTYDYSGENPEGMYGSPKFSRIGNRTLGIRLLWAIETSGRKSLLGHELHKVSLAPGVRSVPELRLPLSDRARGQTGRVSSGSLGLPGHRAVLVLCFRRNVCCASSGCRSCSVVC